MATVNDRYRLLADALVAMLVFITVLAALTVPAIVGGQVREKRFGIKETSKRPLTVYYTPGSERAYSLGERNEKIMFRSRAELKKYVDDRQMRIVWRQITPAIKQKHKDLPTKKEMEDGKQVPDKPSEDVCCSPRGGFPRRRDRCLQG